MSLGREDLLVKARVSRLHTDTTLTSGYIVKSDTNRLVLTVVLFHGDTRLKGYVRVEEIVPLLENRVGKVTLKPQFPRM